jgi:hypothetical protein
MNIKGQILTSQLNEFGYQKVVLMRERKGKNYKVHQLVAMVFTPNYYGLPCINHIDGHKQNNVPENLEWCTYSHNNMHAYSTGLKKAYYRVGEKGPKAKFTNEEVSYIRSSHKANGGSNGTMALARRYGVHKDTITNMVSRKTYYDC